MTFSTPLSWIWVLAPLMVATLGLVLLLRGLWLLASGRLHRGGANLGTGSLLALVGLVFGLIVLNTQTFARLSYERPVAEVQVAAQKSGADFYNVSVRRLDG